MQCNQPSRHVLRGSHLILRDRESVLHRKGPLSPGVHVFKYGLSICAVEVVFGESKPSAECKQDKPLVVMSQERAISGSFAHSTLDFINASTSGFQRGSLIGFPHLSRTNRPIGSLVRLASAVNHRRAGFAPNARPVLLSTKRGPVLVNWETLEC
jgi:hypothetical protein